MQISSIYSTVKRSYSQILTQLEILSPNGLTNIENYTTFIFKISSSINFVMKIKDFIFK